MKRSEKSKVKREKALIPAPRETGPSNPIQGRRPIHGKRLKRKELKGKRGPGVR